MLYYDDVKKLLWEAFEEFFPNDCPYCERRLDGYYPSEDDVDNWLREHRLVIIAYSEGVDD